VDRAEMLVVNVAARAGFREEEQHKLGMAVRESMVNAVVHGNRYNLKKKVHLSVDSSGDQLTIIVTDEGEGFDFANLPDPLAEHNLLRQSGRGLLLMRAFVDEISIRRAPPLGTEVRLVKYRTDNAARGG
ncbi:MAG TPA: ATP-binding protein, partial [Bryobacteraceae bacterium]|nr:ATP-binding protein [Bryobacteraceae bacterium]